MTLLPTLLTTTLLAAQSPADAAAAPAPLLLEADGAPAPVFQAPRELPAAPAKVPAAPPPAEKEAVLPPPKAPRILVFDLVDKGGGPEVTAAISAAIGAQANKSHAGEVVTSQQLKLALDAGALQALLGCDSANCMVDLGDRLEAEQVLGGNVTKAGEDLVITLGLVEVITGRAVRELQRKVPVFEDLYYYAAKEMTSLLLTGRSTSSLVPVRVVASEAGARVIVDGQLRGVSPVVLELDPGSHEVRIEADGFSSWRTLAEVQEGTPLSVQAELVADRLRLWPAALVMGGVSLVATAGALATGGMALELYDGSLTNTKAGRGRSYLYGAPTDSLTLAQRGVEVQRWQLASNVLWGTAGVMLLTAVALETGDLLLGLGE